MAHTNHVSNCDHVRIVKELCKIIVTNCQLNLNIFLCNHVVIDRVNVLQVDGTVGIENEALHGLSYQLHKGGVVEYACFASASIRETDGELWPLAFRCANDCIQHLVISIGLEATN